MQVVEAKIVIKEGVVLENDGYYLELYRVVKKNIDELDCYNLLEGGAPADEFDLEIKDICRQITPESNADEIAEVIIAVFKRWFGVEYSKDILMRMSEEVEHVGRKYV